MIMLPYINRARLTVGTFSRAMSQLSKNSPTTFFEEPLKFIPHGRIFNRFQYVTISVYEFGLCTQLKTSLVIN